ncbi:hypothetical protein Taro_051940 [Colocasia esculenta]|uniref:Retrotransposon gag domain-containing protein n=1 Tax=Colocasia esculenta TaxID=4460 RepID=A0A843XID0_COLES|nr:hypothetical protein [Colocasia esculenta]
MVRTVACESLAELSWLDWDAKLVFLVQAEFPPSVITSRVVVTTSSPAGRALGGRDGAVVRVPVASSGSPVSVYVTLGPFRVPGSVGDEHENWVLSVGRGLGSRIITMVSELESDRTCAVRLGSWWSSRMSPLCPRRGRSRRRGRQTSQWHSLRVQRQQQQEYQPQPQQYANWFPMAEQFFRNLHQGAYQPGQAASNVQFPDQVRLAVYQLKGAAHERDQFHALVQGDLTVLQYHQRFVRLLMHVPHIIGSDQACAERFIAGLRPDLRRDCPMGQALQQWQPVQYAQQPPQYQYLPHLQAPHQQQRGQYQQQAQQFLQPQLYQPYQQQQQYPQQPPQQQQPHQAPQHGRGRGYVMASVLRWCRPARAGDVFVLFGARRSHSFLREGPNGFVLRVECENSMLEVDLASRDKITMLYGVTTRSRRLGPSQRDRNRVGHRDLVATARCVATSTPVEGVLRAMSVLELVATRQTLELRGKWCPASPILTASLFAASELLIEAKRGTVVLPNYGSYCGLLVSYLALARHETSQQRQGARRAEETGQ